MLIYGIPLEFRAINSHVQYRIKCRIKYKTEWYHVSFRSKVFEGASVSSGTKNMSSRFRPVCLGMRFAKVQSGVLRGRRREGDGCLRGPSAGAAHSCRGGRGLAPSLGARGATSPPSASASGGREHRSRRVADGRQTVGQEFGKYRET